MGGEVMKKLVMGLLIVFFSTLFFGCKKEVVLKDVDMKLVVEEKYKLEIKDVYFTIPIDYDNYDLSDLPEHSLDAFKLIRKHMIRQRCEVRLYLSYVLTTIGDKIVYHLPRIDDKADLFDGVVMINYPYAYKQETIVEILKSLIEKDHMMDSDSLRLVHAYSYYGDTSERTNQDGCFLVNTNPHGHLNKTFKPEMFEKEQLVFHFKANLYLENEQPKLWIDAASYKDYRAFIKHAQLYITEAAGGFDERYIYPNVQTLTESF
jgi:hypothetical protein